MSEPVRCDWFSDCGNLAVTMILHPLMGPTPVCRTCGVTVLERCEEAGPLRATRPSLPFGDRSLTRL